MRAIQHLFARLGFVRLRDFGLILTADRRRIISTRPAVLDDGFGARIVGWLDGDLATLELPKHREPAVKPPQSTPRLVPVIPIAIPQVSKVANPKIAERVAVAITPQLKIMPPERVTSTPTFMSPIHITEPTPPTPDDSDDWEWEIAAARARAAAYDELHFTPEAPTTTWFEETATRNTRIAPPTRESPRTVIPVPRFPPAVDARLVRPMGREDVTRSMLPAPRRFPRATNQRAAVDDQTSPTVASLPSRIARR